MCFNTTVAMPSGPTAFVTVSVVTICESSGEFCRDFSLRRYIRFCRQVLDGCSTNCLFRAEGSLGEYPLKESVGAVLFLFP